MKPCPIGAPSCSAAVLLFRVFFKRRDASLCDRGLKIEVCLSPVAAVHVEENDDETQAVTGQVGATKEPGESPCTMLPSRHLMNDKETEQRTCEIYQLISLRSKMMVMMEMVFLFKILQIPSD